MLGDNGMSKNFEEAFKAALKRLGISSEAYQIKAFESVKNVVNVEKVDVVKFEGWFNSWVNTIDFSKIIAVGRYFIQTFKTQLTLGTFSLEETQDPEAASAPQSVSEFEASWDEWKNLIFKLDDDFPSRGVICADDNNYVRAVSDGKGGLIYIDGTVSKKYPRLENLEPAEQQELIERVRVLHGLMANLGNILRSMQEHASTS